MCLASELYLTIMEKSYGYALLSWFCNCRSNRKKKGTLESIVAKVWRPAIVMLVLCTVQYGTILFSKGRAWN